jgi:hypothetical protein
MCRPLHRKNGRTGGRLSLVVEAVGDMSGKSSRESRGDAMSDLEQRLHCDGGYLRKISWLCSLKRFLRRT